MTRRQVNLATLALTAAATGDLPIQFVLAGDSPGGLTDLTDLRVFVNGGVLANGADARPVESLSAGLQAMQEEATSLLDFLAGPS